MAKKRTKSMASSMLDNNEIDSNMLAKQVKAIHSSVEKVEVEKLKRFTFDISEITHADFKAHVAKHKTSMRDRLILLITKDLKGEIK